MDSYIPEQAPMTSVRGLYLDIMKRAIVNHLYQDRARSWISDDMNAPYSQQERACGEDHPHIAHTMIGWKRLTNIENCVEAIMEDGVPGDLIETGVWRGGAVIFMRALLAAYHDRSRRVWVADSFKGVPPPNPKVAEDAWSHLHELSHLEVSCEEVKENFLRYGLLDEQVVFLKGLFQDTLPNVKLPQFSLIRLDGDLYESTVVALRNLYPRLSSGGFVIVDDYYTYEACRKAADEYRDQFNVSVPIEKIDRNAVYWRKA